MIEYDDELGEYFCTVCDETLEHGDMDQHDDCPGHQTRLAFFTE